MGPPWETPEGFRSGFVALVGRPNAGKSTLMNRLVASHVTIVSGSPQTTRYRVRGVVHRPDAQIVFVDTPGLHRPRDPLGDALNERVRRALADADVAVHLVDIAAGIGAGDRFVGRAIETIAPSVPRLLALNKVDAFSGGAEAAAAAAAETDLGTYQRLVCISGLTGYGVDELAEAIVPLLPAGPPYYPPQMTTDQPLEQRIAEAIREAVLARVREEVPHAVAIEVTDVSRRGTSGLTDVEADIVVDTESQKGILVGKAGSMLKAIGIEARPAIEALVETKVYLRLRVRCRRKWRDDPSLLKRFGYAER